MSRTTTDAPLPGHDRDLHPGAPLPLLPKHARKGNWIGARRDALAIVVTLAQDGLGNYGLIAIGMASAAPSASSVRAR